MEGGWRACERARRLEAELARGLRADEVQGEKTRAEDVDGDSKRREADRQR